VDRLACVDAAALPLQLLLRAHPDWVQQPVAPVVVIDVDRPQGRVLWLNERARRAGVRSGQRYATALALAKDLRAAVVTPAEIDESVRALSDCLRHYSPHVEPSTVTPGVFWLDAGGLNRLYPSMQDWASAVRLELQRAGVRATVAVGVSRFGSYALAKFHHGITICLDAGEERAAVDRVPLSALDLEPNARERLSALGIETVGDFLRLPGDAVRQRLGAAADAIYQLAAGRRWAPLVPAPPEVSHERELLFDTPETSIERVLFVVKRLLDSLIADLAQQSLAIVDLELNLILDDRTENSPGRVEHVRPASPTLDAVHLLTLVRLRLDAIRLSSGITTLRVTAETCSADPLQLRLLQQARRDPDAAHQACARLRAEFGEDAVVRARLCDAHLPGARFVWERFERLPMQTAARVVAARPLVRRIFAKPEARTMNLEPGIRNLCGPYTLSGGWWGGGVHRDYYFAETGEGALRWMYYDHRRKRFYLQGGVE
jgi:protein ImuB